MNCRKVNSLLSAYIDSELSGIEQLQIRSHLSHCAECAAEHEALLSTKRMVARLRVRAPRAELLHEVLETVHAGDADVTRRPDWWHNLNRPLAPLNSLTVGAAFGVCAAAVFVLLIDNQSSPPVQPIRWSHADSRNYTALNQVPVPIDALNQTVRSDPGPAYSSPAPSGFFNSVPSPYESVAARQYMPYGPGTQRLVPFQVRR